MSDIQPQSSQNEMMSALFANLVIQQTNMALMLLGHVHHPETGKRVQDVETARMFIDQLEMIEFKTKGNLDRQEEQLLKQSLTSLRMAFVEAVEAGPGEPPAEPKPADGAQAPAAAGEVQAQESGSEESRKKFSKKY